MGVATQILPAAGATHCLPELPLLADEKSAGPAAWRVGTDGTKRRAIVFTPPFGGVRLEALKQDREVVHTWDLVCDRNTFGQWEPEWLPPSGWMSLVKTHCLIENLAIPPPKGVSVRYRNDYDSCMYLSNTSRTVHDIVWARYVASRAAFDRILALPLAEFPARSRGP
jgi:hypothetical protein